jgi:hypothetical protein
LRTTTTPRTSGRFARTTAPPTARQRATARVQHVRPRRKPPQKSSPLSGMLGALPGMMGGRSKRSSRGGSKAKPALAMLAAGAGAILGRQQMRKRKHSDASPPGA